MVLPAQEMLVHAEFLHHGRQLRGSAATISQRSAFVETDYPAAIGDLIELRLSFPGLLAPISVTTQVVSKQLESGPGVPAGLTMAFVFQSQEQEQHLCDLLEGTPEGPDKTSPAYRVLLVDDNRLVREVFSYGILKYFGDRAVTIDTAADGREAWEQLENGSYDLVIVDQYLPVLNGDQLIARMREDPRFLHTPIVAMSVGGPPARSATLAAGADLFLAKPVVIRALFATLARWIQPLNATRP